MPAQPLSTVNAKANYRFGTNTFSRHADLASYVTQVISFTAIAEHKWSSILVDILKADPKTGMAMYYAITSAEGRRAALRAAADSNLSGDDLLLFRAVAKAIKHSQRLRNDFAHHLWGDSPELPDAIILIDPIAIQRSDANTAAAQTASEKTGEMPIIDAADKSLMKVYRELELKEARDIAHEGLLMVAELAISLSRSFGPASDEIRTRLYHSGLVSQKPFAS